VIRWRGDSPLLMRWTGRGLVDMVEWTQLCTDQYITDQVDRTQSCRNGGGDHSPVLIRRRRDSPLLIRWTGRSLVDTVEETQTCTDQVKRRQSITVQVDRRQSCRHSGGRRHGGGDTDLY
jgi:hypothetical protein